MANRTRVVLLVAGNDQGDSPIALALEGDGAANYTYVTAPTISAARAFCGMASPDVLVLEERLPDGEGLALLGELVGAHSELAFAAILLLEAENQALVAQARRLGAYDCLVNGHGLPDYLGRSIAGALAQLELRRENAALRHQLSAQALRFEQGALAPQPSVDQVALNSLSAHIAVLDRDGRIVAVNAAWRDFARANGLDGDEAIKIADVGANYLAVCRASALAGLEDAAAAEAGIRSVLEGKSTRFVLEYPFHNRQAQYWHMMDVTPLTAPEGGVVIAHTDITARRRAEAALKLRETQLAGIIDAAMDAILTVDSNQRIVGWNAAAARMFGCSAADAIGQPHDRFIPDRFRTNHTPSMRAFGETGETSRAMGQQQPLAALRADGSEFPIEASISSIIVGGQILYTAIIRDISERVKSEQALEASRQQLQELSAQLVRTQEDERRVLAYELHDEIGQQLTGLNMTLEAGEHESAERLRAKLSGAQQIVADLTGRVRRLSLDLHPPMLDELGLLAALRWHIERYIQQTGVSVDFKYSGLDAALPPSIAIAAYRIVQEALTNVARHAGSATALVQVWISGGQLKLTIEDQGRGFDTEPKLPGGHSVGLTSMRERVRLLGGQFSLDSAPGEGTHIRVTVPLDATTAA